MDVPWLKVCPFPARRVAWSKPSAATEKPWRFRGFPADSIRENHLEISWTTSLLISWKCSFISFISFISFPLGFAVSILYLNHEIRQTEEISWRAFECPGCEGRRWVCSYDPLEPGGGICQKGRPWQSPCSGRGGVVWLAMSEMFWRVGAFVIWSLGTGWII